MQQKKRCVYVCEDDSYKIKASCCVAPAQTNIVPLFWWLWTAVITGHSCQASLLLSLLSVGFISVHSAFMGSGK